MNEPRQDERDFLFVRRIATLAIFGPGALATFIIAWGMLWFPLFDTMPVTAAAFAMTLALALMTFTYQRTIEARRRLAVRHAGEHFVIASLLLLSSAMVRFVMHYGPPLQSMTNQDISTTLVMMKCFGFVAMVLFTVGAWIALVGAGRLFHQIYGDYQPPAEKRT